MQRKSSGLVFAVIFLAAICPGGAAESGLCPVPESIHTADQGGDHQINLTELLRVIQFFNSGGYHCYTSGEDGYAPGPGDTNCAVHRSDYNAQDWQISLSELLRLIQFFNSGGYHYCPGENTEDGLCPGAPEEDSTPPSPVSNFAAVAGDGQVSLSWVNPPDSDFAGVRVLRRTDAFPSGCSDGDIVYTGLGQTGVDSGLVNGVPCYYAAFAFDTALNSASGATAGATPTTAGADAGLLEEFSGVKGALADLPGSALDPAAVETLVDLLEEAENAYRGGAPCAAIQTLAEYLSQVQPLRNALTQPFTEDFYNRGHMLRYWMAAGITPPENCPEAGRLGQPSGVELDEEASDNTRAVTEIVFGEPKLQTLALGGEVFTQMHLPGADSFTGAPGKPAVPVFRRLIAAPRFATAGLQFQITAGRAFKMNLCPTQYQPVDQEGEIDPVFGDRPFVKNLDVYGSEALYPPDPVSLTDLGYSRDLHVLLLEVAAGQYNPVSGDFTLFDSVHAEVPFSGGSFFLTEASLWPFENTAGINHGAVLNASDVFEFLAPVQLEPITLGEELLILTPPALRAEAQRLADWKNEKGIVTNVFDVIDGDGPGPDSPQGIDVFIENRYNSATIRPSYILLFGDSDRIPTFYVEGALGAYFLGSATIGSDWQYACVSGEDFELLPEFSVGRIPVDTIEEAGIVVDKIIGYEQTPPEEAAFYMNAAIAAQFQCCRQDTATPGTDSRTFIEAAEFARNILRAHSKQVDRIYVKTGGYNVTPSRYYDGNPLPSELGANSGFAWDGVTDDIKAAWNEGRFLMIHRDHGSYYSWIHPYLGMYNLDTALTNGGLLPVVFSVNCASGWYDKETSANPYDEMSLVETLLRMAGGGAVAVLGDTRNSPSWPNSVLLRGFMDAIWPDAIADFGSAWGNPRLGDILNHAKLYLLTQINCMGTSTDGGDISAGASYDELRMWHAFGDPTLELWTEWPYGVILPENIASRFMSNGVFEVILENEGATATVFRDNPTGAAGKTPVGRGTIRQGAGRIELLPGEQVAQGEELEVVVTLGNAISRSISVVVPIDETAPGNVLRFAAAIVSGRVSLSWENPSDSDFAGVHIRRGETGYPATPQEGEQIYDGSAESIMDNKVVAGRTYYYTAFAYDGVPNYASGVNATAAP